MMQDYPQLLEGGSVGFVTLTRNAVREYAPVKNSPESAIDKVKQGLDAHCASSGEADFYALHGDFLRCGRDVVIGGGFTRIIPRSICRNAAAHCSLSLVRFDRRRHYQ